MVLERLPWHGKVSGRRFPEPILARAVPDHVFLSRLRNKRVIETMKSTLDTYGAGAGGTRNIAGNAALHLSLEAELADLHRKEAALVFSSCYVANDATREFLSSLASLPILLHTYRDIVGQSRLSDPSSPDVSSCPIRPTTPP